MSPIEKFQNLLSSSQNIVFFGGAGVSTESGIPDFRSTDGLYNQTYQYPPETILSHSFYRSQPHEFYRFYHDKMLCLTAQPNAAHYALAALEKEGKLKAVITQNIDGLHQKAGSRNVLELHGSIHRNFCESCGKFFAASYMADAPDIPRCDVCGGTSLVVYPAAGLVRYYRGHKLVLINKSTTDMDTAADLILRYPIGETFEKAGFAR